VATGEDSRTSLRVAINGRAAVRAQIGGVERYAREMVLRLPRLRPRRYRVIQPPAALAHRSGHLWEQATLPIQAARCALVYSPANLAPVVSGRNVVVIHDAAALRYPEAYSRFYVGYQRLLLPALARRARLVITVSEFSRRELAETLDVPAERTVVIPEGVDERFGPQADAALAVARYRLERPYVLAVGTISARKNLALLEPAVRALAERGVDLVVAGSDRGYLRSPPVSLRRLGYVPDEYLPGLYVGARALAMPSLYEGFGLPCLEAMACGTPVVAARSGALPETVGDAGLLVDGGDRDAFAEALVEAACDDQVRAHLGDAGSRRAHEFSWNRTAALTDAAIERVLVER
jgi:glycosyltransferase involved in cell wall biosynthesis